MGGCAGKPADETGPIYGAHHPPKQGGDRTKLVRGSVHENVETLRRKSVHSLDAAEVTAAHKMFHQYRDADVPTAAAGPGKRIMTKDGLRQCLGEVDDHLFEYLWKMFDHNKNDGVDADEFVMSMALLSKGQNSTEAQLEAAFVMFDANKSGELTRGALNVV